MEDLVDELCEKLREIEKQNNLESEVNIIKAASDIEKVKKVNIFIRKQPKQQKQKITNFVSFTQQITDISSPIEDPTKRYYRAFPPLSKNTNNNSGEISTAATATSTNATAAATKILTAQMPLTWPRSGSSNLLNINPNVSNTAGVKKKTRRRRNQGNKFSHKRSSGVL